MGCWVWREWDEGKRPARGRPGRRSGKSEDVIVFLPVISEIYCVTLFSLRGGFQSGGGEREQGLYGTHEAGPVVLGYYC